MNTVAQAIKNRLSLRQPQAEALRILTEVTDTLELKKEVDIRAELEKVRALYPTCSDFERDFPSLTFSLATGVGKTRLMGAFIAYLYSAKGIKNFFILAPGSTIYNKLIAEFSQPNHPKYVFRGISEFAQVSPAIITGETYNQMSQDSLFGTSARINIFNIQKINSEMRGGKEPRIKRLAECLGDSYFNYLAGLQDLVVLMDESHHYHADAGLRAINELRPILGLELTATPKSSDGTLFRNTVYEYSLANALKDGFVKEPAVATRRNFNPDEYRGNLPELDLIKLEDGLRIHEDTKVALDIYARDTGLPLVKPFVLVVARDTDHAREIREKIESDRFFGGRYAGKVMEIHSNQRGEEKEENIERLLSLESPTNPIEIVVHVNMLKEGWDVTNLYTIIPLRTANSEILIEQTMGRGLRLPYGSRTGVSKVDTLTIIAHDRFQAIIDAANREDSLIRKENIIEIDPATLPAEQEIITSTSGLQADMIDERHRIASLTDLVEKQNASIELEAKQLLVSAIENAGTMAKSIGELTTPEIRQKILERVVDSIENAPQQNLFKEQLIEVANREYATVANQFVERIIPIPRILIQASHAPLCRFEDFDLDTKNLNYQPVSEEIVRQALRTNTQDIVAGGIGKVVRDTPENIIVNELVNYPEIDYDRDTVLLYKIAGQALQKLKDGKTDDEIRNIVLYHRREIGLFIYTQLKSHFRVESTGDEEISVYPFTRIEPHNFAKYTSDSIHDYRDTITPTNTIPSKVFGGFQKACHSLYKFDSKTEKDFAAILEKEASVIRWLRPAQAQFQIYWNQNTQRYVPDFIVETENTIYMIEAKAENEVDDTDVREKARVGAKFCATASEYGASNGGKKWKYILIPHTAVTPAMSLGGLVERYGNAEYN